LVGKRTTFVSLELKRAESRVPNDEPLG